MAPRLVDSTVTEDAPTVANKGERPALASPHRRGGGRLVQFAADWGPMVLVGVLMLALWQVIAMTGLLDINTISDPTRVVVRLWGAVRGQSMHGSSMWANSGQTITAVVLGYLVGAVAGLVIGYVLARIAFLAEVFEPYVRMIAAIPKITLVPLLVLIFGIGIQSEAANVVLMTFVIVVFSTFSAVTQVNEDFVHIARIMGAKRTTVALRIIAQAALPAIMGGLRAGVPSAFVGAITSEFIASSAGLGWFMQKATSQFDSTGLFTGLVFVLVFVLLMVGLIGLLERALIPWKRG